MTGTFLLSAILLSQTAAAPHVVIKDDAVGKGPDVKAGDIVSVDYVGTLADGSQFDTTSGKSPIMFIVGMGLVIKGWDQGLIGMKEGGKRELTIPPSLGYGDKATGPIPASSILHFTVALLKIEPKVSIEVLTKGAGAGAKVGDIAYLNFTGGVQGQKIIFDTKDRGKDPIPLLIGNTNFPIGFVPALVGMQEGEKRKVVIPPILAYGPEGVPKVDKANVKAGSLIAPNSTMEFTFELVKLTHTPPQ